MPLLWRSSPSGPAEETRFDVEGLPTRLIALAFDALMEGFPHLRIYKKVDMPVTRPIHLSVALPPYFSRALLLVC